MKVRTKFAVLILALTLLLGGVVYGQLTLAEDRSVSRMQENVDQTADKTAEQINTEIQQEKNYVGFYASRPDASDFGETEQYLQRFLSQPNIFAAHVIAANGTVLGFQGDVAPTVRQAAIGEDFSNRTYVERTIQTGEVYVTDAKPVDATDQHVVVISAPIFEDREIVGVLAAAIPVNEVTFLTMVKPLETGSQTVTVQTNEQILHESQSPFVDNVSGTATVSSTGWTVRVSRDRSPLNAQLREMAILQSASLVLILSLVVGLSVWEYKANRRRAEKLLDGFSALRSGDYDRVPDLSSGQEWGQIREGYDELADALAERETELKEREQRLQVFNRVLRHNLRNDVTVVVNYAEFVAEESDDEPVQEAAEKIASRGWDLVELGEKASSIESAMEGEDPRPTPVDVTTIAMETASTIGEEHPEADVSVEVGDDRYAKAIPALGVAVENVCENAVEHNDLPDPSVQIMVETIEGEEEGRSEEGGRSEDGGRSEIEDGDEEEGENETEDESQRWVRITVADNGPGIPEQERIVLTEGEETALEHGSGLGLWLVHWVVERSDGRLSFAESEPRGSVVQIDLRPADDD